MLYKNITLRVVKNWCSHAVGCRLGQSVFLSCQYLNNSNTNTHDTNTNSENLKGDIKI